MQMQMPLRSAATVSYGHCDNLNAFQKDVLNTMDRHIILIPSDYLNFRLTLS